MLVEESLEGDDLPLGHWHMKEKLGPEVLRQILVIVSVPISFLKVLFLGVEGR